MDLVPEPAENVAAVAVFVVVGVSALVARFDQGAFRGSRVAPAAGGRHGPGSVPDEPTPGRLHVTAPALEVLVGGLDAGVFE